MFYFDEYVTKLEARRTEEKRASQNAELIKSLRENTKEEVVKKLFSSLAFFSRLGRGFENSTKVGAEFAF